MSDVSTSNSLREYPPWSRIPNPHRGDPSCRPHWPLVLPLLICTWQSSATRFLWCWQVLIRYFCPDLSWSLPSGPDMLPREEGDLPATPWMKQQYAVVQHWPLYIGEVSDLSWPLLSPPDSALPDIQRPTSITVSAMISRGTIAEGAPV